MIFSLRASAATDSERAFAECPIYRYIVDRLSPLIAQFLRERHNIFLAYSMIAGRVRLALPLGLR